MIQTCAGSGFLKVRKAVCENCNTHAQVYSNSGCYVCWHCQNPNCRKFGYRIGGCDNNFRYLSDDDIIQLTKDPYEMFRPLVEASQRQIIEALRIPSELLGNQKSE